MDGGGVITLVVNKEAGVTCYLQSLQGGEAYRNFDLSNIFFPPPYLHNNDRSLRKRSVSIKQLKQRKIFEISLSEMSSLKEMANFGDYPGVSGSNLETRRYGSKSGVSWIIRDSWKHWCWQVNLLPGFKFPGEYSWKFLVGLCCPVLKILSLFCTKKCETAVTIAFVHLSLSNSRGKAQWGRGWEGGYLETS